MKKYTNNLLLITLFALPAPMWASSTGSASLPWEQPLRLVAASLTGPVALAISTIALMAAGGVLVFGGELNQFARQACIAVLAISFLVAGSAFMNQLFGVSGALV